MNKFIVWEKTSTSRCISISKCNRQTRMMDMKIGNWTNKKCWYFHLNCLDSWINEMKYFFPLTMLFEHTFLCLRFKWSDRKVIKFIADASGAISFFFMSMKWQYVCIINCVRFQQKLSDSFFKCNRYGVCEIEDKIVAI